MTGSFLFVKPSDPEGKHGTAYSDAESPRYPYDHASWEWLLERALRRMLLPWALTKSHSRELLYGHEDKYSMRRWGSYGESNTAGITPDVYQNVGGPGSSGRETDADLSQDDRYAYLPYSWRSSGHVPPWFTEQTKIKYGVADLEEAIAKLPFSLEWLYPGWSTADLKAWDITASTTVTTQGSKLTGSTWTWKTAEVHVPYSIPSETPFKCLSHMRTDDPTVKVNITNDDNKEIEVELAPTPLSAPRTSDGGSIIDYYDKQIRDASSGAALGAGWALSAFSIPYLHGQDYTPSTGSSAYAGSHDDIYDIGALVDIPEQGSGNIKVTGDGFVHEVDWNGKPTWWHAKEFPKGLDSIISEKLRTQLEALCPVCQPSLPPAVPAFQGKFPEPGTVAWKHDGTEMPKHVNKMLPQAWMQHFALACTPLDISARLDAMTTTVHSVPGDKLFAKIKTVTTEATEEYKKSSSSGTEIDQNWWSRETFHSEVTVEGTTHMGPFPTGPTNGGPYYGPISGPSTAVVLTQTKTTSPSANESENREDHHKREMSFKSTSEFLVCLRSLANTTTSTKTTTKTLEKNTYSNHDPVNIETEDSDGELPESYDPGPDDLLFPDWVLPWIESAELFASIESRIFCPTSPDLTEIESSYTPRYGDITYSSKGIGRGTRTHKVHRKIVKLGDMNTSTGRFSEVDAAAILLAVDPDASVPYGTISPYPIYNTDSINSTTNTTDSEGNKTVESSSVVRTSAYGERRRSISYYVVVKWKFDRTDPESLETESPLGDLYRKLEAARKALSDKERELSDAQSALAKAESDLESAEAALEYAQGQLEDPEGAEAALLAEAWDALASAGEALIEAQEEKTSAQSECDAAEERMKSAERSLQSAQAAYDAAVEAGEGIEEAQAALERAYTVYNNAVGEYGEAYEKLENAEANESIAQADYDAAQEYYDTLHDRLEEILQKAVDDAQTAISDANSRIENWTGKIGEIEAEIPDLEAAVEAAEQAIRDAKAEAANQANNDAGGEAS